jgi:predicted dehydrogenase
MKATVIGAGNAGKFHVQAYASLGVEPAENPEEADIVSIASPDDSHCEYALKAIERSKHVLMEKPPTHSGEEWVNIVEALNAHPEVAFACNLPLPFHPPFLELKRRIRREEFGDIYLIEADYNYGRKWKLENGWRGKMPGYSVILGGGIHMIDLAVWLKGFDLIDGAAFGCNFNVPSFKNHDTVTAVAKFSDGALARFSFNFGYTGEHIHRVAVWGTKDRVVVENKEEVDKTLLIREFVSKIRNKEPVSQARLRHVMGVCFKLESSAHEN